MTEKTEKILNDISRIIENVYSIEELRTKLNSGKKLIIKFGADVTAPFLHLGHAVNLWAMRRFQEDGHKVVFLVGDFTTKIGDPSGRSDTRPVISDEDIRENSRKFIEQISKVLITDNPEVFEVQRNSDWMDKMNMTFFIKLLSMITHARLISRDMFQKRIEENKEIFMHEIIYPIIQGYDSFELKSDLTIVGNDQLFNETMGRFYQEKFGQTPQVVLTTKITSGIHGGPKQSKSLGNYIALEDTAKDKYGKTMGIPDDIIIEWLKVYTNIPLDKIAEYEKNMAENKENPLNVKHILAYDIVRKYHGEDVAIEEQKYFKETFSTKTFPSDAPVVNLKISDKKSLFEIIYDQFTDEFSRSDLKRLFQQNSISINGETVSDISFIVEYKDLKELQVKIGKRKFLLIVFI